MNIFIVKELGSDDGTYVILAYTPGGAVRLYLETYGEGGEEVPLKPSDRMPGKWFAQDGELVVYDKGPVPTAPAIVC